MSISRNDEEIEIDKRCIAALKHSHRSIYGQYSVYISTENAFAVVCLFLSSYAISSFHEVYTSIYRYMLVFECCMCTWSALCAVCDCSSMQYISVVCSNSGDFCFIFFSFQ